MISFRAVVLRFAYTAPINTESFFWTVFAIGVYIAKTFTSVILIASFRFAVCALKVLQTVEFVITGTIVVGLADTFLVDTEAQVSCRTVMTL